MKNAIIVCLGMLLLPMAVAAFLVRVVVAFIQAGWTAGGDLVNWLTS